MPYTIEVRWIGADLAGSMAAMRTWLDSRGVNPTAFEHSSGGPGITFRVSFREEEDALSFAQAFRGAFNQGTDPHGTSLWQSFESPS
jgi:hypothetical protein